MRYVAIAVFVLVGLSPGTAQAVTLVTCPAGAVSGKYFAVDSDSLSSGTVTCYDYGDVNDITGDLPSDDFNSSHPWLSHLDYDDDASQSDGSYSYTEIETEDYRYGTFTFGSALTGAHTALYLGFKTGQKETPVWAVFELTNFTVDQPLTGTWYIYPKEGSGVSHSSIYGNDIPPDRDPPCEQEPCEPPPPPDSPVPEPTSMVLLGSGLVGLAARARQRRRQS